VVPSLDSTSPYVIPWHPVTRVSFALYAKSDLSFGSQFDFFLFLLPTNFPISMDSETNSLFSGILFPILGVILDFKYKALLSAFEYYLKSFQQTQDHPGYFSLQSFFFVIRFIKENILFIFLWIYTFIKRKQTPSPVFTNSLLAANAVAVLFIFFHNERLPFFILSLIPILVIYTSQILRPWIAALFLFPGIYFIKSILHKIQIQCKRSNSHNGTLSATVSECKLL
jgi:hypothetical protein